MTSGDEAFMERALSLACHGLGWVNPNPMVGAVVVRDGRIIGEGWHRVFGGLHAERDALAHCAERPEGATMYVTLEPCCHWGKTPPCTDAILEAGIARIVVGSTDPNPLVAGEGLRLLSDAGVEVVAGVLRERCDELNKPFFHYIVQKTPYVLLKYAMTLDGKTATRTGASRWITSTEARRRVHVDRQRYSAVMVGVGTVIADDPELTCRLDRFDPSSPFARDGRFSQPLRVIVDTHLRTPLSAQLVQTTHLAPTVIATCEADEERWHPYLERGCDIMVIPDVNGVVDLLALMWRLGEAEIDSLVIEGGSTVAWAALQAHIVNGIQAYIATKLFGGAKAPTPIGGLGVEAPDEAFRLGSPRITLLGPDILVECEVV